jgi:hypothetical protein
MSPSWNVDSKLDKGCTVGVYSGMVGMCPNKAESNDSKLGEFVVGGIYPSGMGRIGPSFSNDGARPEMSRVENTSYGWSSNGRSDVSLVVMKSISIKVVSSNDRGAGLEGPGLGVPFPAASAG